MSTEPLGFLLKNFCNALLFTTILSIVQNLLIAHCSQECTLAGGIPNVNVNLNIERQMKR